MFQILDWQAFSVAGTLCKILCQSLQVDGFHPGIFPDGTISTVCFVLGDLNLEYWL